MNGNKRPPLFSNLAFAHVDVRSCDCELRLMWVDVDFLINSRTASRPASKLSMVEGVAAGSHVRLGIKGAL